MLLKYVAIQMLALHIASQIRNTHISNEKNSIDHSRGFEKMPTRSSDPRVGSLYYYGTLFYGAKIFMRDFLLYDVKYMLKGLLMRL